MVGMFHGYVSHNQRVTGLTSLTSGKLQQQMAPWKIARGQLRQVAPGYQYPSSGKTASTFSPTFGASFIRKVHWIGVRRKANLQDTSILYGKSHGFVSILPQTSPKMIGCGVWIFQAMNFRHKEYIKM